jgi:hypothetical protein
MRPSTVELIKVGYRSPPSYRVAYVEPSWNRAYSDYLSAFRFIPQFGSYIAIPLGALYYFTRPEFMEQQVKVVSTSWGPSSFQTFGVAAAK